MMTQTKTASATKIKISPKYVFHVALTLFFFFGFQYLPPVLGLNQLGMAVVGIFLGMLYGWIALSTFVWPCLVGMLALCSCGYDSMNNLFAISFGNNLIPFLIFIFVYVTFLERAGVCNRISNWFLGRKIVAGHPWVLIFFIFMSAYVMGICTYSYPAALIPWAISYSICEEAGYKKGDKLPAMLVLGISVAAFCGYTALPIKPTAALGLTLLDTTTNGEYTISFVQYCAFMIPMTMIAIFIFMALMRFVFKVDVANLKNIDNQRFAEASREPMSRMEKVAFGSMVAFIIMMCLPTLLPVDWGITQLFDAWGMNGPLFIVFVVLAIFMIDGKEILDFSNVANAGKMNWNVIIMTAACFAVAEAIGDEEVGIMNIVFDAVGPVLETLSPAVFIILSFVLMSIMTQFLHNLVLCSVMTPVLVQFALMMDINPAYFTIILIYAFSIALCTPAASGMAAMTHSNEWTWNSLSYKALCLHFVISLVVISAIFVPLAILLA